MKELTQPQCEALVDLICLALSTDGHVTSSEELAAHVAFARIGWHSKAPREIYIADSLARAEHAMHKDAVLVGYMTDRAGHFKTASEKKRVLDYLMMVLEIDGVDESEDTFITRIHAALGLGDDD
jgi:hypothetical protein